MTEITSSNNSRAVRPLRVHTREIEGGGCHAEKSPERTGLERAVPLPFITVINFSKNGRQKILS
ncbi:hypothetical protein SAMN05216412_11358 [Nitrosospira multiformis]|uniref:Uncharacterized protein n=1 Tax=Nitrosospira multiformis TaxID=1231 RepID=A0A1I0GJ54_9PROT|nr:hypothetical protein SAMN05216412_11358 [Nitrosospira multiformis]